MRTLIYLFIGILFGIVMFKSEAASWFRIYEMFHLQSFHMYGIMGSSLGLGLILVQSIKKFNIKSFYGEKIEFQTKEKGYVRYIVGGILFGLGWALAGACPGPIYTLIGVGYLPMILVLVSAIFGTFLYGLLKDKLPH